MSLLKKLRCLFNDDICSKCGGTNDQTFKQLYLLDQMVGHYVCHEDANYYKKNKEGLHAMCEILEDLIKERNVEIASHLLDEGNLSTEVIARCCDLSIEEVEELKKKKAS